MHLLLSLLLALGGLVGADVRGDEPPPTSDASIDDGDELVLDTEEGESTDDEIDAIEEDRSAPGSCLALAITDDELEVCARSGTWRERLEAGSRLTAKIADLTSGRDGDETAVERLVERLIPMVHQEQDDWIAREWLDDLKFSESPAIDRLFRAVLSELSINLRATAVIRLEFEADPEAREDLDRLWRDGTPGWLRHSLIDALARQGIDDHLDEFIDFVGDTDPEVRMAALRALGTLGRPEGTPALLRAADEGDREERETAVESLGQLAATPEIVATLSRLVRSDGTGPRGAAIRSLGSLHDPNGDALLLQLLDEGHEAFELQQVATALTKSTTPGVTAAIAGLLGRIDPEADRWTLEEVVRTLHNRDDPAALPDLMSLDESVRQALGEQLDEEIAYLSRDRSVSSASEIFSIGCGGVRLVDADDPRARRVAPPAPFGTVRCWEAPSVAGESWRRARLPAGDLVLIDDYFERPEETWVQFRGRDFDDCWAPLSYLAAAGSLPPPTASMRLSRVEFDLPADVVVMEPVRRLLEAGSMDILESDRDEDVVAAALSIDPADPDQVALLQAVWTKGRGALDRAIERLRRASTEPLP